MALAYDTGSQNFAGSGTSDTFNLTLSASATVIYAFVMSDGAGVPAASNPTWNGVAMTAMSDNPITQGGFKQYGYYLYSPATGTNALACTYSSASGGKYLAGHSYTGGPTTGTPNVGSGTAGSGTSITSSSVTITNTGGWRVCSYLCDGGGVTSGSGNTLRGSVLNTAWGVFDTNGAVATGTMTQSSSPTSGAQSIHVSEIVAISAGVATPSTLMLLGIGI
tara:strand:- start:1311 stop:1973 length:663 start_codon:yes stop_codon:yes gene_type:complete